MTRGQYVIIQTILQKGEGKGLQLAGLDIRRIAIVFIVTLVALYGGRAASYNLKVTRPLHQFFAHYKEVLDYTARQCADGLCVSVTLDNVQDIQSQYARLWAGIEEATGRTPAVLNVADRRDEGLEETFRRMRIHIEEALAKGSFYAMSQAIDEEAKQADLDRWGVDVDSYYVYVQLHKGENYLYEIIPRGARREQHSPITLSNLQSALTKKTL
ncbi:MAG: hypothetical protein GX338_08850 [Firmicutes bacterium]|jgi:hypothetical protein|nr:hypothetical protein [Bacillota bacterium]